MILIRGVVYTLRSAKRRAYFCKGIVIDIAMLFKSIGVRGRFHSPETKQQNSKSQNASEIGTKMLYIC